MTSERIAARIEEIAREEGFDLAGASNLAPPPDLERFDRWLADGWHGQMDYLERFRDRIAEPSLVAAKAKSILCLGVSHGRPAGGFRGGGRVGRYALGRDYHNVIEQMLRSLARRLESERIARVLRFVVDAGPVLERSLAARAALGFASKSGNLLHHKYGPWFFLAEVFLDIELGALPSQQKKAPGSCGTCVQCLVACPTGAIVEPGRVDARLCISYLTIEHRGAIPEAMRAKIGDWVFGCDVCSEVCPFGDGAPDASARFGTHAALDLSLEELLRLTEAEFARVFAGSPLRRAKREGIVRNACIALGNLGRGSDALAETARADPSPVAREAAAWALARL